MSAVACVAISSHLFYLVSFRISCLPPLFFRISFIAAVLVEMQIVSSAYVTSSNSASGTLAFLVCLPFVRVRRGTLLSLLLEIDMVRVGSLV